jgi:L-fuconolactonase
MKPQFRAQSSAGFNEWAQGMSALAQDTNAFCKLSGLVTEADTDWSDAVLQPYTEHVLNAFGADRVMWGSDWPVSRLRCSYPDWHAQAMRLTGHLGATAQKAVFGGTARQFYKIT